MANEKNLIPLHQRCKEDAKKIRSAGGYARAKKIKEEKQFESFQLSAQRALIGIQADSLKDLAKIIEKLLKKENVSSQEIKTALEALEFLRDSSGQKPTEKQEITETQTSVVSQVSEDKIEEVIKRVNGLVHE